MKHLREDFLKTYSNLPFNLRDEIILVFKGEPFTWSAIYLEIKTNTELGKKILKELKELDLI